MARYGYESRGSKTLELDFWLTVGRGIDSDRPSVKVTAGYPQLARNERALNLKVTLPLALFEQPTLTASIKVDAPERAIEINTDAIAEAVSTAIGLDVDIAVVGPEQTL